MKYDDVSSRPVGQSPARRFRAKGLPYGEFLELRFDDETNPATGRPVRGSQFVTVGFSADSSRHEIFLLYRALGRWVDLDKVSRLLSVSAKQGIPRSARQGIDALPSQFFFDNGQRWLVSTFRQSDESGRFSGISVTGPELTMSHVARSLLRFATPSVRANRWAVARDVREMGARMFWPESADIGLGLTGTPSSLA